MKHVRLATIAVAMACSLSGISAGQAQTPADMPPPAVLVQPAVATPLSAQSEFIGRAAAIDKVELRARVKGVLGPRQFTDGDAVKQGQLLFTIEREPYHATLDQKIAQRDSAKAALVNAEAQLQRAAELLRSKTGTQVTYDQRLSEQLQAKAAVADAEAQVSNARIELSYTEIKSPITGRIGKAAVSPGNIVGTDSGVLATVVNEHPMRVLFPVTQRELMEARRGGDPEPDSIVVQLKLADGSLYKEKGKIDFIDVTVDPRTDGQIVRAVFDNKDNVLTDGQTLRVVLEEAKAPSVVAVPQAAIAIDQSGSSLFVVNDKNVVEQRRVKTGVVRGGLIAINDGLKAGEKVVIQGQQRIRPGMTVAPTDAPAASPAKQ